MEVAASLLVTLATAMLTPYWLALTVRLGVICLG